MWAQFRAALESCFFQGKGAVQGNRLTADRVQQAIAALGMTNWYRRIWFVDRPQAAYEARRLLEGQPRARPGEALIQERAWFIEWNSSLPEDPDSPLPPAWCQHPGIWLEDRSGYAINIETGVRLGHLTAERASDP